MNAAECKAAIDALFPGAKDGQPRGYVEIDGREWWYHSYQAIEFEALLAAAKELRERAPADPQLLWRVHPQVVPSHRNFEFNRNMPASARMRLLVVGMEEFSRQLQHYP